MIAMNNLVIYLLHCQQQTQKDTTCLPQVTHHSQRDHPNDSLIVNITTFDGKPGLYFKWNLKLENIADIKCQRSFVLDMSLKCVKRCSLVLTVIHA